MSIKVNSFLVGAVLLFGFSAATHAELQEFVAGYVDEDGKQDTAFEGCQFGRKIVFDDNRYVVCREYHYHYAYHPQVTIFQSAEGLKMAVAGDDHIYSVSTY
jgi:hypothetical protein